MAEPAEPTPDKQPTMAELQAMAEKAVSTAEEAKSAAEARQEVKASVKEEGEAQGFEITEAQAEMIATVTIAQLEERGAFASPGAGGTDTPPVAAPVAESGGGDGAPVAPPGAEPVGEPADQEPGSPAAAAEEPVVEPRRPSLAERFQGK